MEQKDVLINRANTIINETEYFANDGPRVGGLIKDVVEYADSISQGQVSLGTVANLTALNAIVNPSKGDRYIVSDQINPANSLPYYYVWSGSSWVNTGETIINADAATKTDLTLKTSRTEAFNVSQYNNKYDYTDNASARNAVPTTLRGLGQQITYKLSTGELITEYYIGTNISGWGTNSNWKSVADLFNERQRSNTYPILGYSSINLCSDTSTLSVYGPTVSLRGLGYNVDDPNNSINTENVLLLLSANTVHSHWTESKKTRCLDTVNRRIYFTENKECVVYNTKTKKIYLSFDYPLENEIQLVELRDNQVSFGYNAPKLINDIINDRISIRKSNYDTIERFLQQPKDVAVSWVSGHNQYNSLGVLTSTTDTRFRASNPIELPSGYTNNWYVTTYGVYEASISTIVYFNKMMEVIDTLRTNTPLVNYKIAPPKNTKYIAFTDVEMLQDSTGYQPIPFKLVQAREYSFNKVIKELGDSFYNLSKTINKSIPSDERVANYSVKVDTGRITDSTNFFIKIFTVNGFIQMNCPVHNSSLGMGIGFYRSDWSYISGITYTPSAVGNGERKLIDFPIGSHYMVYSYLKDSVADSFNAPRFDYIRFIGALANASESKDSILPYTFVDMGIAFDGTDPSQLLTGTHSSWPHANVAYDRSLDKFIIFYDIKAGHTLINNRVAMRFKDPEGNFSNLLVVADRMSEGISCKTQASGIAANGDYISLVAHFVNSTGVHTGTSVYRSTNKGSTWTRTDMVANGEIVTAYNGDVTGFLVLESGRIITLACHPTTRLTRILYSDDNGVTWIFATIPECYKHTEPAWCELSDGTIICYMRSTVGDAGYTSKVPAYFTRSYDSGLTWELPVASNSILNMNEANGQLIFHKDSKTVEFIHHSRFPEKDGYTSILQSCATEEDASNDRMGFQVRIGKLPVQGVSDAGYVGAAIADNGVINAFYYSGSNTNANICYLIGKKYFFNTDPVTLDILSKKNIGSSNFWEQGGINNITVGNPDTVISALNRLRTKEHISIFTGATYQLVFNISGYSLLIREYDENKNYLGEQGWVNDSKTFAPSESTKYFRYLMKKNDDSNITIGDVKEGMFSVKRVI